MREFHSLIDCHSFGKRGVRPYDVLLVFRRTLAPGSTRLKVYDTVMNRARKRGWLPDNAKKVLDEVISVLRRTIRETKMEKKERAEKVFDELSMGRLPHSAFRAEWERCLDEMEDAGIEPLSSDTLYRRYLRKITPELRTTVLKQVFALDLEGPPRKPTTWEKWRSAWSLN